MYPVKNVIHVPNTLTDSAHRGKSAKCYQARFHGMETEIGFYSGVSRLIRRVMIMPMVCNAYVTLDIMYVLCICSFSNSIQHPSY